MYTIYSKDKCVYCNYAKKLLKSKDLEFEEYNVYDHLDELTSKIGERPKKVPQIFNDEEYIGGYEDLYRYLG